MAAAHMTRFEQQIRVARRLERHGAGVRMSFSGTSPRNRAERITTPIGKEVTCRAIPVEGARRLAGIAKRTIQGRV